MPLLNMFQVEIYIIHVILIVLKLLLFRIEYRDINNYIVFYWLYQKTSNT